MTSSLPKVAPFRALRYSSEKVPDLAQVIAPPYDVISAELQSHLYAQSPYNVIRLELGEIRATDTPDDNRYTRAAHDFGEWIRKGILTRDVEPSFYLYQQEFAVEGGERRKRRGFFALRRLEEFGGAVRPHETTMEGPKKDRFQLMQSCHANLSPIFMIYPDSGREIASSLGPFYEREPVVDLVDGDSVCHRLWQVKDPEILGKVSEKMEPKGLLIADGHHRYEVGLAYRREMLRRYTGPRAPHHYILTYFNEMDDPGLVIFPTHRVVLKQGSFDPSGILARLRGEFEIESFQSKNRGEFLRALEELKGQGRGFGLLMSRDQKYHLVVSRKSKEILDVIEVHETLFRKILGIGEQEERDPGRVLYLKEEAAVFRMVEESSDRIGILLNPPKTREVIEASEKGIILPPKSTYFYPKLVTGLVFHWMKPEETV